MTSLSFYDGFKEIVKTINPKLLFPIHTEHPGMFRGITKKMKLVKGGKRYKLN